MIEFIWDTFKNIMSPIIIFLLLGVVILTPILVLGTVGENAIIQFQWWFLPAGLFSEIMAIGILKYIMYKLGLD